MPALKARSPIVAMETSPLSEAQTARLLATECHRLKSEYSSASSEYDVLWKISDAEGRVIAVSEGVNPQRSDWLKVPYARRRYLHGVALEMCDKMADLSQEIMQCEQQLAALRASGPINDSSPSEEAAGRDAPLGPAAASDPAPMVPEERCGAVSPAVRTQLRQRRVISHVPAF